MKNIRKKIRRGREKSEGFKKRELMVELLFINNKMKKAYKSHSHYYYTLTVMTPYT